MMKTTVISLAGFVVLGLLVSFGSSAEPAKDAADAAGFKKDVQPFLDAHCTKCHGAKKVTAGLNLAQLNADILTGPDAKKWRAVLERIASGEMPPEKEPRPKAEDVARVGRWLTAELARAERLSPGKTGRSVSQTAPQYGNKVNHATLFSCTTRTIPDAPPRVWRISPYIYARFVGQVGYKSTLPSPFSLPAGHLFKDYAAENSIDEPSTAQLIRNAQAIVASQVGSKSNQFKEFRAIFEGSKLPTRSELEKLTEKQVQLVLRRLPTSAERSQFVALFEKNISEAGLDEGLRTSLAAILLHPEALYRSERGSGQPDADGLVRLTPREIALALCYALGDVRVDAVLGAAEKGDLDTREGIVNQFNRLWDDKKFQKTRLLRFFQEYFGYHYAVDVFKDPKDNKDHHAQTLVSDTDKLVQLILDEDKNVFEELLTTNRSFVAYSIDNKTKKVAPARGPKNDLPSAYNVPYEKWSSEQPMRLPKDQRAGILTQPSWLVAWSANTENHAILRGKWIRERLLGGYIPDLPITVDAQLPEDPKRTLRDRMNVTREDYCWQCHQKMNDLGLALEMFDHFGRFRTTEIDKPVDSTGLIAGSGDPNLDGPVSDGITMIHKLAKSDRVRQVFIRHAFRYWMGRNETPGDAWTLVQADRAYRESGGSMKALLLSLLTSDSFLYRRVK